MRTSFVHLGTSYMVRLKKRLESVNPGAGSAPERRRDDVCSKPLAVWLCKPPHGGLK